MEEEVSVKEKIVEIKKQYHDASHHCYVYVLGHDKAICRINDDGEPSGTAGRPIYGQILSKEITNILIVVVRYFGGVKLGTTGLINAYKTVTKEVLEQAEIIHKRVEKTITVSFNYIHTNKIMQLLKTDGITIQQQNYDEQCMITFKVRWAEADTLLANLLKIEGVETSSVFIKNPLLKS